MAESEQLTFEPDGWRRCGVPLFAAFSTHSKDAL
eukprot:gene7950-2526_t